MKLPSKQTLAVLFLVVAGVLAISVLSNNNDNSNKPTDNNQSQTENKSEDNKESNKDVENAEAKAKAESEAKAKADAEAKSKAAKEQQAKPDSDQKADSYNYVAQAGDTYSQMARKAIQTYGKNNNVNLSQAQIIYAETMLTQAAGSPSLNQGQAVAIGQDTVKSWVEKAGKLSDAAEKLWQAYTVGVDFNTNNVGEARS